MAMRRSLGSLFILRGRVLVRSLLFRGEQNCVVRICSASFTTKDEVMDKIQEALLEEKCILVDENDRAIGAATKRTCHLNNKIAQGMLHRAFSVFLFNSNNELLLQQRSDAKVTFPDRFTNTCCSHPLHCVEEMEEAEFVGVKRAAQRKLYQELGIKSHEVPIDSFEMITRIHYKAMSDDVWGEHEIDHVLFIQKDVNVEANPNEVKSFCYVDQKQMREMLQDYKNGKIIITPWFELLCNKFLFGWWDNIGKLNNVKDQETIHYMVDK